MRIYTLDVSTAFLYAGLSPNERQVIQLPNTCLDPQGKRIFLYLSKALYTDLERPLLLGFES